MDLPMPMRFRHLKKTSKEAVGVYRYGENYRKNSRKLMKFSKIKVDQMLKSRPSFSK